MNTLATRLALLLLPAACATDSRVELIPSSEYVLTSSFNAEAEAFDITLQSNSSRDMCLSNYRWPNTRGYVISVVEAQVRQGGRSYSTHFREPGYCIGDEEVCSIRIPAGTSLSAIVLFSEFEGWDWRAADARDAELSFPIVAWTCQEPRGS